MSRQEIVQKLANMFRQYPDLLVETLCALNKPPTCEGSEGPCEQTNVRLVCARTMYPATEEDPHPNQSLWLCPRCAEAYHGHWDSMWSEYYGGLL